MTETAATAVARFDSARSRSGAPPADRPKVKVPRSSVLRSVDEEGALLAAVAAGDRTCFERLYLRYEHRVFHYARSIVRDPGAAEEVVVDTMMAVWEGARRCTGTSRLSTWILGIAHHKALDVVRRRGRSCRSVKLVALDDATETPDEAPTPDAIADAGALTAAVHGAFAHLTSKHREVLYLAFYKDLPYEEIATLLALPVNTVKTRVYYAKQSLRNRVERFTSSAWEGT